MSAPGPVVTCHDEWGCGRPDGRHTYDVDRQ
ncbi:hypothetical protein A2U01_0106615, partial [Trifolium medium]|nr:hypothetical protein [Trifolium medium]